MNIDALIQQALDEDIRDNMGIFPTGDHSSLAIFGKGKDGHARLLAKDEGVLAGVELALEIFKAVDATLDIDILLQDGSKIKHGDIVLKAKGNICSLLRAERVVLNFMQRMSGIATMASKYVEAVKDTNCSILDTRKTTPNLRHIEKWAVRIGGASNHRFGLYDMIMLKDNHVDFSGGIANAIKYANEYLTKHAYKLPIEIETRNLDEVAEVLSIGQVDRIMLDNFTPMDVQKAVNLIAKRFETEASGGITLETVRDYALAGVDFISVGALTHSVRSLDLSFKASLSI